MKKWLLLSLSLMFVSSLAMAYTETLPPASAIGVVPVSNGYDWSLSSGTSSPPIQLFIRTIAQINALPAIGVGSLLYCSNCVASPTCVSTGTAAGSWVITGSTNTMAALVHCQ